MNIDPRIERLIKRGALFVINHSGGKDSQAMAIFLKRIVPAKQLVMIHAELPGVDWEGIPDHIRATEPDLPLHFTRSNTKTFLSMVEDRGMFPSPQYRQCTSDLKRDPIARVIRRLLKEGHGRGYLIVNCMGIRAEESTSRAKAVPFTKETVNCKAGREWYRWYPIHDWSEKQVFQCIADAGQKPHPAYAAGMTRLSCCFCIMASKQDIATAAHLKPALFKRYADLERRIGQTMMMPVNGNRQFLPDYIKGVQPRAATV